jgi:hypothetical protein
VYAIDEVQEPTITTTEALSHRDLAILLYKERRARDVFLESGRGLWSDPAWDMLLDLFIANEEGRMVNVTSACIGGCIPTSTGLRRVDQLLNAGLIHRTTHPSDGRKGMLGLTPRATNDMKRYLDEVLRSRALGTAIARGG